MIIAKTIFQMFSLSSFVHLVMIAAQTPTTTQNNFNLWQSDTIVALHLGDSTTPSPAIGNLLNMYLDEFDPMSSRSTYGTVLTKLLISTPSAGSNTVRLSYGIAGASSYIKYEEDGIIQLSQDGRYIVGGGYFNVAAGSTPIASTIRGIVRVYANGFVDTSTAPSGPLYKGGAAAYYSSFHTVASKDGSFFYTCGVGTGAPTYGYHYVAFGGTTSVQVSGTSPQNGYNDARSVLVYNNQLYGGNSNQDTNYAGISTIGTGLPSATLQTSTVFTGMGNAADTYIQSYSPGYGMWNFYFDSP
jgi:hypothetical protein